MSPFDVSDEDIERETQEILAMDPDELARTRPELAELVTILRQKKELAEFMGKVETAAAFTHSLPRWIRMVFSIEMYSPEAVAFMLKEQLKTLNTEWEKHDLLPLLMTLAIHRIHRFGAGPAPASMEEARHILLDWLEHQATSEQREALREPMAEMLADTPLEADYGLSAFHSKVDWPILIAEPDFYAMPTVR